MRVADEPCPLCHTSVTTDQGAVFTIAGVVHAACFADRVVPRRRPRQGAVPATGSLAPASPRHAA